MVVWQGAWQMAMVIGVEEREENRERDKRVFWKQNIKSEERGGEGSPLTLIIVVDCDL